MISWVTVVWSMIGSICLTLALVHGMVWWRRQSRWASAVFAMTAVFVAATAACELWMMRAETPVEFGVALRWIHAPVWLLFLSLVLFVRLYLRAGRNWLAWAICGVRTLSLLLNFLFSPNLNYREITALRHVPFLGESVSVAEGVPNPWMLVGQLSFLLLIIFAIDAAVAVWRRGDRRQALIVGGAIAFFTVIGGGQAVLFLWGIVHAPITASAFYLGVIAAMSFELSRDLYSAELISDELRQSEERMSLAAEAANLSVWVWDLDRDEIWMTKSGRNLLGFPPDGRLDYAALIDHVHPEDRLAREEALKRAIATHGEYEIIYRVALPDGGLRWLGARGSYLNAGDGHPARLIGVSMDITSQRQAQEALRESEARFRAMANSAPVMIWMSGTDKLCTYFNKGWLDFTGRTLEREVGNGWAEGVHPEDFDRCLETYVNSFDARKPFSMEYRLRRSDGEYRWLVDIGTPRFSAGGDFLGYIGSCIDVSDRKIAEEAAHSLSGRLIHAQEEAQKLLARELHDDIGQSLALLSIELEMFGQSPTLDPTAIAARMEEFSTQVKRLSSEVHQLSHELHPAKLDQLGLVAAMRGFCKEFARAHEMAVDFTEYDVPRTTPDNAALCIYRITQEALHNSVKHSGGTAARVELSRLDGQLRLVVTDDGAGFNPEVACENGSLGLVSMSERARYAGGRFRIESRPGEGARVELCLPITSPEIHSPKDPATEEPALR